MQTTLSQLEIAYKMTTASNPPSKGAIRIINKALKQEPTDSDANGHVPQPTPSTPPQKSPEEIWTVILSEAEGDMSTAADIISQRINSGNLQAASAISAFAEYSGVVPLFDLGVVAALTSSLSKDGDPARHAALVSCSGMSTHCTKAAEPLLLHLFPAVLACYADKLVTTREAAAVAATDILLSVNPHSTASLVGILLNGVSSTGKWQTRIGCLKLLEALSKKSPGEMGHCMLSIMPALSEAAVDTRPEVAEEARKSLLACCYTAGNRDLEPNLPALVSCIARPSEVSDVIAKLSATTFVQAMEDASLAVLVPLMDRALKERSAKTQRRASVIINNMSKLVMHPSDARPFLPVLIPALDTVAAQAADPELREVAGRARDALTKIKEADEENAATAGVAAHADDVAQAVHEAIMAHASTHDAKSEATVAAIQHIANLGASLISSRLRGVRSWDACIVPYLAAVLPSDDDKLATQISHAVRKWALTHMGETVVEDDGDAEDELCNCEFSLAYGGRILLTNTTLRLRRGHRYGLCGHNGAGKSTLMRAIANGQLDGFPPKEELRTVLVEHDIDSSESETSVADFIFEDATVQEVVNPTREMVKEALSAVGFSDELQRAPLKSLSGGWKMKLALARAMLVKADILLLDEPTNHLDTTNVAWLQQYLTSMPDVSSMIVSHDSGFLDAVCTDIIHYENRKLVSYPGNLSAFVAVKPEAKTYYELSAAAFKFKFPEPGFLDGVKGKRQPVMRTQKASYTYPGAPKPQLTDVTVRCTLGSRVAVLGRNGAGKSTLIKMLTGETLPTEGVVWKHPNLRIAYVAQHAFHHIENHLDKTPSEYLWWRFGDGEDREAKEKVTRKITDEEKKARQDAIDRGDKVVDYLNSRRMGSKIKEYEYEIAWVGQSSKYNTWVPRSELCEKMGLSKLVEEMDAKLAMLRLYRPLSTQLVLSHLGDFGLEEEIAAHNHIRGLSGGQKVKLVLSAAMWCQPHVLVLDEPTNYLDRDSLGALAAGIQDFNGGVIMISHNSEFTSALCHEEWHVADGKVTAKGQGLSEVASMASLASVSSVASLSTMSTGGESVDDGDEDPEAMEEKLKLKASKRADKERLAAEKAAKKAEKAKLRFSKKF